MSSLLLCLKAFQKKQLALGLSDISPLTTTSSTREMRTNLH